MTILYALLVLLVAVLVTTITTLYDFTISLFTHVQVCGLLSLIVLPPEGVIVTSSTSYNISERVIAGAMTALHGIS